MIFRLLWVILVLVAAASPSRAAEPSPAFSARATEFVALFNGTAEPEHRFAIIQRHAADVDEEAINA